MLVLVFVSLFASVLRAQPTTPQSINLITFAGGFNLYTYVAQRQGFFAKHGVEVSVRYTPNSVYLMTGLTEGRFDIATASIDNLVAYQEGQGEAPTKVAPDLAAILGFDGGFLTLVAAPEVKTIGDLRGKDFAVDALTTGFAFVARDMFERAGINGSEVKLIRAGGTALRYAGLVDGKFPATLLSTPFDLQAEARGFRRLGGATELLGAYQGRSAFAMRSWLREHEAAALGFMRAMREAMDWIFDPKNREVCEAILLANDRDMTPELAKRTYALFVDPKAGLYRDLRVDPEGLKVVLGLRAKYGEPRRELGDPAKYVDAELYRKAFPAAAR
jgi:ABC-type nitrate/sulfonate/bicarbonate transport system substrate-binding protein